MYLACMYAYIHARHSIFHVKYENASACCLNLPNLNNDLSLLVPTYLCVAIPKNEAKKETAYADQNN